MRKIIGFIFAFLAIAIVFAACGGETYSDKLKKEEKAINKFLSENKISVLNKYPDSGVFAENEYFKDPTTGVYIHVVNPGTDDKPTKGKTTVYLRYSNIINMLTGDTVAKSNKTQGMDLYYMDFIYGNTSTYYNSLYSTTQDYQEYSFLSQGCVLPLDYGLGNKAEVKLIIPFVNGSVMQQASYIPLYYGSLKYTFINDDLGEN